MKRYISEGVCKMFLEWLCSSVYYHGRVAERAQSFICITVYRDAESTKLLFSWDGYLYWNIFDISFKQSLSNKFWLKLCASNLVNVIQKNL